MALQWVIFSITRHFIKCVFQHYQLKYRLSFYEKLSQYQTISQLNDLRFYFISSAQNNYRNTYAKNEERSNLLVQKFHNNVLSKVHWLVTFCRIVFYK